LQEDRGQKAYNETPAKVASKIGGIADLKRFNATFAQRHEMKNLLNYSLLVEKFSTCLPPGFSVRRYGTEKSPHGMSRRVALLWPAMCSA
jgi:hypothetical protein